MTNYIWLSLGAFRNLVYGNLLNYNNFEYAIYCVNLQAVEAKRFGGNFASGSFVTTDPTDLNLYLFDVDDMGDISVRLNDDEWEYYLIGRIEDGSMCIDPELYTAYSDEWGDQAEIKYGKKKQ